MKKTSYLLSILLAVTFVNPLNLYGGEIMQLQSKAFEDNEQIPVKYCMPGAGGKNVSIPLHWADPPPETKSYALTMIDPHPVANNWIHWMVIDIPRDFLSLEEGASGTNMPQGSKELTNSFGKVGYGGPQPPAGTGEHPYVCTVYALNVKSLDLAKDASLSDFQKAIEGKVLEKAECTGVFEHK